MTDIVLLVHIQYLIVNLDLWHVYLILILHIKKKSILSTDKNANSNPSKVPNWKLNDLNYTQVHFSSKHKSDYNEKKRNIKTGLANNIVINMLNEAIDDDKSNKCRLVLVSMIAE